MFALKPAREAEAGEPHPSRVIHEHIGWLDVLVNQAARVHLPKGPCKADGDLQEMIRWQRPTELTVERPSPGERRARALRGLRRVRAGLPRQCQGDLIACVLPLKPFESRPLRLERGRRQHKDSLTRDSAAIQGGVAVFPQSFQRISGNVHHRQVPLRGT